MRQPLTYSLILAFMVAAPALDAQPTARVTVAVSLSGTPPLESRLQMCIGTSANRRLYGVQWADASGSARFDNVPANAAVLVTAVKYGFKSGDLAYTTHAGSNNQASLTLVPGSGGPTCWGPLVATSIEGRRLQLETTAGQLLNEDIEVSVRDQYQNSMAGVTVRFAVTGGGGTVSPGSLLTSETGKARFSADMAGQGWRLGTVPGVNTLTATAENLPPVVFTATGLPGAPRSVTPVMPTTSTYAGLAGAPLTYAPPMTVVVRDLNGSPVPGVNVAFAVTSGGGTLAPSVVVTGSDGSARPASWVLGPAAGMNTASATVANIPPATVKVYGALEAKSMQAASAVTQQALAGSSVPAAPAVIVRDQFNSPMQGITVSFAIVSGDGSVAPSTTMTGADGIARVASWMAGTKGPSVVRASTVRLPAVSFTSAVVEPFTLIAYVKRSDGTPIPSAKVCVGSGRELGAFGVKTADANGRAVFTLPVASQYAVTAAIAGYAGKTILFTPTGSSGTTALTLATGLIGATCPTTP